MTYIIGLSGPPGAGKNALADELVHLFRRAHGIDPFVMALAGPLRQIASALTGVDMTDDTIYAKAKATPFDHLNGETGRQVMINITEQYLKPRYGSQVWADAMIRQARSLQWRRPENERVIIVTDVGFKYERQAIVNEFAHPIFVELSRPGCSYVGDSRGSIKIGDYDPGLLQLTNPGEHLHQLTVLAGRVHDFVLNRLQWDLPVDQIALPLSDDGD